MFLVVSSLKAAFLSADFAAFLLSLALFNSVICKGGTNFALRLAMIGIFFSIRCCGCCWDGGKFVSKGSVVMRGNCPFSSRKYRRGSAICGARSLKRSLFLLNVSSVAGGRIRRVGTVASRGARGAAVVARMALRWVSRTHIFLLTLIGVMLNDQYS